MIVSTSFITKHTRHLSNSSFHCLLLLPFLTAAAPLHDHVFVVLERDLAELVEIEHGDGGEVRGAALHRRDQARVDAVHQRLGVNSIEKGDLRFPTLIK